MGREVLLFLWALGLDFVVGFECLVPIFGGGLLGFGEVSFFGVCERLWWGLRLPVLISRRILQ